MTWLLTESLRWAVGTVRAANKQGYNASPAAIQLAEENIENGEIMLDAMLTACKLAHEALTDPAADRAKAVHSLGVAIGLADISKAGGGA